MHRQRVKFNDLPARGRAQIVLLAAIQLTLLVAAEIDIQVRPASEINGPKNRWRLISLINFVGPLSYFRWGRKPVS